MKKTDVIATRYEKEKIGYCDDCGLLDHHLLFGVCPRCRDTEQPEIDALADWFIEHQLHERSQGEVSFEAFLTNPRAAMIQTYVHI